MEFRSIVRSLQYSGIGLILSFIALSAPVYAGTCSSASCSGSGPWTSASASYEDVDHCVNACAGRGDTVIVPADNRSWGEPLTISKGVILRGAGIGSTTINCNTSSAIVYEPDSTALSQNEKIDISGFTFNGATDYTIHIKNHSTTPITKVKIHDNRFADVANGIVVSGAVYGVAYANEFDRAPVAFRAMGSDQTSWANFPREYGSPNNFYFEDNTITFSTPLTDYAGWIESGQGGRAVVRYNTWIGSTDELWDVHGLQTPNLASAPQAPDCEQYSTMVAEFYGNRIDDGAPKRWMNHRGSWLMMFNNAWNSSKGNPWIHNNEYSCDSCAKYGYGEGQHINNTYVWSNIANGAVINMEKSMDNCGAAGFYSITENVDFYNYAANFDGSSGVGCGPLAQRPSSCTTGVAYWATDQSCSDLSGMAGTNPTTPISGTLYKCTAPNEWTAYYKPYGYPHPLRKPETPRNLTVH